MKILYVTTISNTANTFLVPHIRMLVEQGHQVDVAFNIKQDVNPDLLQLGCKVHELEFQRSPLNRKNYSAYRKLKKVIKDGTYDIVHTHTPIASACVRMACRALKSVKVIYTAHGFHFFKGAPLKNWLIYYPIEKCLAKYTDVLITINKEDAERAKKSFNAGRVEYIPGVGLNTERINNTHINWLSKRKELGIPHDAFVIISIGELNKNKNHETVIRAIAKLGNPKVRYLVCGVGPLMEYLVNLSKELGIEDQVKLLGYRGDVIEICKMSNIFCFPSMREGLGMAALEAMASGLPIITSDVHGIVDYSLQGITGYTCNPTDIDAFAQGIKELSLNPELCKRFGNTNMEAVKGFSLSNVLRQLKQIYGA
ncbi:glycosyltransferase family 4 protein [Ectobacillus ponti]|uniref:Glycosyltransferase family 4 protein n=1 Tax=Ectobacillus ponti TaxID=2961894 RepID=A0AA42BPV8_9BACI|nr:glycosyltransferase family 4 protein [Ectobacillus ponti]MCP8967839.1 glycosyltransferase family 4 protein [Ectobacillus ponti]